MKTEKHIDKLKRIYNLTNPPKELSENGWLVLQPMLEDQVLQSKYDRFFQQRFIFISTFVLFVGIFLGSAVLAQAALPGEPLYAVKRLSENFLSGISTNKQLKIDNRADEIIKLSEKKKDPEVIKETVKQYQQSVLESKKQASISAQNEQELNKKLEEHEKKFEEVSKQSQSTQEELKNAIEAAKGAREDKDSHKVKVDVKLEKVHRDSDGSGKDSSGGK